MNRGKDRLIVALDVSDHGQAVRLVQELDNVLLFKIGLEFVVAGNVLDLMQELQRTRSEEGGIFLDLKVAGDIGNTIIRFVKACASHRIKFITLGAPAEGTTHVIQTAVEARAGSDYPKLLGVPLLSSVRLDGSSLTGASDETEYILQRGEALISQGCDGLIVSGRAIQACRDRFQHELIVSPGIRPSGTDRDDHERLTTPGEAIAYGSDYLVVGRPILNAPDRKAAAQHIIDEIDEALDRTCSPAST